MNVNTKIMRPRGRDFVQLCGKDSSSFQFELKYLKF